MRTYRSIFLILITGVFLATLGVALGVTLGRVGQSAAGTLTLRSSAVLSSGDLGLWHDRGKTNVVTSLQFEGISVQPPLRSIVTPVEVFVENLSTSDLFLVKPCGDIFDSTTAALIGTMDADVHDLGGKRLGNTCDSPPTVKLNPGNLVRAELGIDLVKGLASGDFRFDTLFEAVVITADAPIDPPAGMVSWWPGDGNASDIVDGNHGTLTGDFATGMVGQGFSLDGTGDFVLVPNSASLNITGDVTVDLWAKRTSFGAFSFLVSKGGGFIGGVDVPTAYLLGFNPSDELRASFELADGSGVDLTGQAVVDDVFHHYAYVRSGNNHKLYFDGQVAASGDFNGRPGDTSTLPLTIGSARTDSDPTGFADYFGGVIDEVEIFNHALSSAQIKAIFDAGSAGKRKPTGIAPPAGMVSWWSGDGNANDIMDGKHGTLTGDATFTAGMVGQGFILDGTGDVVVVPDSPNLNITGDVTVDMWARRTVIVRGHMIAKGAGTIGTTDAPDVFLLAFDSEHRLFGGFERADGTNVILEGPVVTDTNFHHYAYVRSSNSHKLFMDGVMVTGNTFTGSPGDTSGIELAIGSVRHDPAPTGFFQHFAGIIDEVEIFNRALSAAEIRAIFDAGSSGKRKLTAIEPPAGMVSWWPGDGNASDIVDGNHGTLSGGATATADGMVGRAFSFDGTGDVVVVPDSPNLNITGDVTVDLWAKRTVVSIGRRSIMIDSLVKTRFEEIPAI